jgi:hypothetical protein
MEAGPSSYIITRQRISRGEIEQTSQLQSLSLSLSLLKKPTNAIMGTPTS